MPTRLRSMSPCRSKIVNSSLDGGKFSVHFAGSLVHVCVSSSAWRQPYPSPPRVELQMMRHMHVIFQTIQAKSHGSGLLADTGVRVCSLADNKGPPLLSCHRKLSSGFPPSAKLMVLNCGSGLAATPSDYGGATDNRVGDSYPLPGQSWSKPRRRVSSTSPGVILLAASDGPPWPILAADKKQLVRLTVPRLHSRVSLTDLGELPVGLLPQLQTSCSASFLLSGLLVV